jgi:hypothetical protein
MCVSDSGTTELRIYEQLDAGVKATADDLRFASQTIQADLDRFQRQKVADLKEMSLAFVDFHKDWCQKVRNFSLMGVVMLSFAQNIQQWREAAEEIKKIEV